MRTECGLNADCLILVCEVVHNRSRGAGRIQSVTFDAAPTLAWGRRLVAAADEDGFAAWVRPHLPAMAALAARLVGPDERDDVVQEALARAWRKRDQYDDARGTARAWLLAIVADRGRRFWRGRARRPLQLVADPVVGAVPAVDPSGVVDLERALADLPRRMRMAVDCVYFVGLTVAETATVMDVSAGTVKSTLSDARARLQSALEERE
jgi:DNA-directed RNA polymerase specialized sigma24 family protein